jgi:hypothetical protein
MVQIGREPLKDSLPKSSSIRKRVIKTNYSDLKSLGGIDLESYLHQHKQSSELEGGHRREKR